MARMTEEARAYRRELLSHLSRMHGGFAVQQGDQLTIDNLETIHDVMHRDNYGCPPHEHKDPEGYSLGKIKLSLGKGYIEMLKKESRA